MENLQLAFSLIGDKITQNSEKNNIEPIQVVNSCPLAMNNLTNGTNLSAPTQMFNFQQTSFGLMTYGSQKIR